jgi:glucose-1-phosphate thymidylyltransferase
MKGIVLAGGTDARLLPATQVVSKQLLPVYDKPMIYYPLSVLMLAGIVEILVISPKEDLPLFRELLGDGERLGIRIEHAARKRPGALPEAFLIGERFIGDDSVALILGDNIFYGPSLGARIMDSATDLDGCVLFGYPVRDPERYRIAELDSEGSLVSLEDRPTHPRSNRTVTGLYLCDNDVVDMSKQLRISRRGKLEITDIIRCYMLHGKARMQDLGRGYAWLETGTPDSFLAASQFVQVLKHRQGVHIGCLEEIALRMGYIDPGECAELCSQAPNSEYTRYIRSVAVSVNSGLDHQVCVARSSEFQHVG